jgi:DNA-binding transcriptional LysR family regulator
MGLRFLEDFLKLAETGSFSRAAEERHVTQPAFSRRIQSLENYLGVELVDRSSYPLTLTAAGQSFRDAGLDILKALQMARRVAREIGAEDSSIAKVAALHSLAIHYYPRYYGFLRQALNSLTVHMTCDNMHNCMQSFVEGACHYLLVFSNPSVPLFLTSATHPYILLERDELVPLCAPGPKGGPLYPLPGKAATRRPYLSYGPNSYLGRVVEELLRKEGRQAFLQTVYVDDVAESLKAMAKAGYGVAFLPRGAALAELAAGTLVPAGDERWTAPLEVRVYHRTRFSEEFKQIAEIVTRALGRAATA